MKRLLSTVLLVTCLLLAFWLTLPLLTLGSETETIDPWLVFDRFATLTGFTATVLMAFGLMVAWSNGWLASLQRSAYRFRGMDQETVATEIDSLLVLVGIARDGSLNPTEISVDLCKPKRVAAIYTPDSADEFRRLRGIWTARGIRMVEHREIAGADDFVGARRAAAELLAALTRQSGGARPGVGADITGTTKPIGIGAFVAAEEAGIASVYLLSSRDTRSGAPLSGTQRLVFLSRPNQPRDA